MPARHPGWPRRLSGGIHLAVLGRHTFVGGCRGDPQAPGVGILAEIQVGAGGHMMAVNHRYLPSVFEGLFVCPAIFNLLIINY